MIPAPPHYEAKRYAVESLPLARLVVSERRMDQRGTSRQARTIERWARRQWRRRYEGEWSRVGNPTVSMTSPPELFMRARAGLSIDQRAIHVDDDWRTAIGDREIDTKANAVAIPVRRGEWPEPPPMAIPSEDDECDCGCCEH